MMAIYSDLLTLSAIVEVDGVDKITDFLLPAAGSVPVCTVSAVDSGDTSLPAAGSVPVCGVSAVDSGGTSLPVVLFMRRKQAGRELLCPILEPMYASSNLKNKDFHNVEIRLLTRAPVAV